MQMAMSGVRGVSQFDAAAWQETCSGQWWASTTRILFPQLLEVSWAKDAGVLRVNRVTTDDGRRLAWRGSCARGPAWAWLTVGVLAAGENVMLAFQAWIDVW